MKKVIFIANPYKPMETIGTKRVTEFLKYMQDSDWEPVVFAPKIKGAREYDQKQYFETIRIPFIGPSKLYEWARKLSPRRENVNNGILAGSSSDKQMGGRRAVINDWLFIPDESVLWSVYAALKARSYARNNPVDLCFASGPAYSTLVGGMIFSKLTNTKLITDFRDPWMDNDFIEYKTKLHDRLNRLMEKQVVKQSAKVITVGPFIRSLFLQRYNHEPEEKFEVLYNGYDQENIPDTLDDTSQKQDCEGQFVVTHTGKFYGKRNPDTFLRGLVLAKEKRPDLDIKVQFVGRVDVSSMNFAKDHHLNVLDVGRVSHDESLAFQKNSDLLLLVPGPGKGTVTGKFTEYLYAKRPIFCVGIPGSDLDHLIENTDSGVLADATSPEDICEKILCVHDTIKNDPKPFTFKNIEAFDFRSITNELLKMFDEEMAGGE